MTIAIPEFRLQTCLALISAGTTQSDQLIGTVSALEKFVFGAETPEAAATPDIKNAKAETTAKTTKKAEKVEETKAEAVAKEETTVEEIQTSTPNFTKDEVHKALVAVAKDHGRPALVTLLKEVNAEKLTDVAESDYPKLMKLVEEYPV